MRQTAILAERYADGAITYERLDEQAEAANAVSEGDNDPTFADFPFLAVSHRDGSRDLAHAAVGAAEAIAYATGCTRQDDPTFIRVNAEERRLQAGLARDIFGNPFKPVKLEPSWLAWNGGTIGKAALAAYEERALPSGHLDNERLAVLADMLEEAGCRDDEILSHLRKPDAVHVRGCFVVDLLLSKE